jgi:hypothetical protein
MRKRWNQTVGLWPLWNMQKMRLLRNPNKAGNEAEPILCLRSGISESISRWNLLMTHGTRKGAKQVAMELVMGRGYVSILK